MTASYPALSNAEARVVSRCCLLVILLIFPVNRFERNWLAPVYHAGFPGHDMNQPRWNGSPPHPATVKRNAQSHSCRGLFAAGSIRFARLVVSPETTSP